MVVAATFLFTAALVWGPYRRGLLYRDRPWHLARRRPGARRWRAAVLALGAALIPWGLIFAAGAFDAVVYAVQGHWPNLAIAAGSFLLLVRLAPRQSACARFAHAGAAALPALRAGP